MKRDMDLVRDIVLKIEAADGTPSWKDVLEASDADADSIGLAHLRLMYEQGLVGGIPVPTMGGWQIIDLKLTWAGHEFADSVRDPAIWTATKEGVEKAGGFSLDLIKALAKGLIKKKIEQHTGVDLDI